MRAGPPTASTSPPRADGPLILERYLLQRPLGAGGFGTVWLARDERLERDVAVKILPRARVNAGRFEREARAAARLSHPVIVTLYEAAADDEGAYLVSELVRGPTLERALSGGKLSDRAILEIGVALCDGLEHAHGEGIVHRDVKPSNILLPARASGPPAKLTDFGIARVVGGDTLTRTGELVGTEAYMAPEQAVGREAGEPADLYSLALVLYEALTGVNPVSRIAAHRRLSMFVAPLRRQRRELPRELGQAIDLALRPRPGERGSIAELRAGLQSALARVDDTPGVVAPSLAERPSPAGKISQARPGRTAAPAPPPAQAPAPAPALPLPARAAAALTTAGATAWMSVHVLAISPAAPAAAAAVAVLALPRLGWLALTAAAAVALLTQHHPGYALLLAALALPPVVLLPRAGWLWPLPMIAPALGLAAGVAGAWPALAGRAGSPWRRAALGACGWASLQIAGLLAGRGLFLRLAPMPAHLASSASAVGHALATLPAWGVAGVWAAAAALLPVLRLSTRRSASALAMAAWAVGLLVATTAVEPSALGPAAIGALTGILSALAPLP